MYIENLEDLKLKLTIIDNVIPIIHYVLFFQYYFPIANC